MVGGPGSGSAFPPEQLAAGIGAEAQQVDYYGNPSSPKTLILNGGQLTPQGGHAVPGHAD